MTLSLSVRTLLPASFLSLRDHQSVAVAHELMKECGVHHLPVVDRQNRLLGLVSLQDILRVELQHAEDAEVHAESDLAMPVSRIMAQSVKTIDSNATVQQAIRQMLGVHHGCVPVVDGNAILLGIVTENDVLDLCLRWLSKHALLVADIMTRELVTTHRDMSLADAAALMARAQIHHLPVAGRDGELEGLISHGDLLSHQRKSSDVPPRLRATHGIKDLLRKQLWTTTRATPAVDAAQTLRDNPFRCLPVVEDGHLMGIVTATDFFKAIINLLDKEFEEPASDQYVAAYLRQPVHWMTPEQTLAEAVAIFSERRISSVLVGNGQACFGLLSQSDVLRAFVASELRPGEDSVDFLNRRQVFSLMTTELVTVSARQRVSEAARLLVKNQLHHLVVMEDKRPIGILRSVDCVRAVQDSNASLCLSEMMTNVLFTLDSDEPIGSSVDYLRQSGLGSLVVREQGRPIGVFGQREAVASLTCSHSVAVETRMSPRVLCLQSDLPAFRAAQQASALDVEQIVVMDGRKVVGFVSSTDFATLLVHLADLARADLARADLARADVARADLARADLARADVARADLARADVVRADVVPADVARADVAQGRDRSAEKTVVGYAA